mmetsp:Transcript_38060/g.74843  ORF Transcript_38060/g.74843 Transcript_38060/m.74843 type:complete len:227 (+) Transcript_38060:30-710(+)
MEADRKTESGPEAPVSASTNNRGNLLLGLSGSVASMKAVQLVKELEKFFNVQVVTTHRALHFFDITQLRQFCPVFTDAYEWDSFNKLGDAVQHIELRKWADVLLIAPLSANTLAKLSNGLCDNLLTCVARAWDLSRPFLVAPAMNTHMWSHPFTSQQLAVLQQQLGVVVVDPVSKLLACGDYGTGALAVPSDIAKTSYAYFLKYLVGRPAPSPSSSCGGAADHELQ